MGFTTKDSGKRESFDSGMVRDTQQGKTLYHLVYDGPLLDRWAELLTRGAEKYSEGNWMKAEGEAELRRFKASAARHFRQWYRGDTDEDHAAAVAFNLNGAEYVKDKMKTPALGVGARTVLGSSIVAEHDDEPKSYPDDYAGRPHVLGVEYDLDKCGTTDGTTPIPLAPEAAPLPQWAERFRSGRTVNPLPRIDRLKEDTDEDFTAPAVDITHHRTPGFGANGQPVYEPQAPDAPRGLLPGHRPGSPLDCPICMGDRCA